MILRVRGGKWWIHFELVLWKDVVTFYRQQDKGGREEPRFVERGFYLTPFNWLRPDIRYWGYRNDWYDGPLPSFGFWFFNINWGTL